MGTLTCRIDDDAREAFVRLCGERGVTPSAMLAALAEHAVRNPSAVPDVAPDPGAIAAIARAAMNAIPVDARTRERFVTLRRAAKETP